MSQDIRRYTRAEMQQMVDEAVERGGTTVYLPPGIYEGCTVPAGISIIGSDHQPRRGDERLKP